ncbi:MAG: hypothetical protein AB7G15_09910 [Alphaproteobacteria bacterium]
MLAIAKRGRPPEKSGDVVATFVRHGLVVPNGTRFRLTPKGRRAMMDCWTKAIVDGLGTYEHALKADRETQRSK